MKEKCFLIYVGQSDASYMLTSKRDYGLKREPQIGFAYLAAVLRECGVEPEIIDFTISPHSQNSLNDYIAEHSPIFAGFYAAAAMKDTVLAYLRSVRQRFPELKIFLGGPDMYDCQSYLEAGADVFCLGEGEKTIVKLVDYCRGKIKPEQIKGIAYRENGKIKRTPPQELINNLDELPLPAWDKFDLNKYYDYHVFDMARPYVSIMASRGCPFRCTYCLSHKIWKNFYRRRSPENVLKEIDELVQKQKVKYIKFQDDIWSWNDEEWAKEFCQKLTARNYNLKWRCILHPTSFLKSRQEILPLMRQAGCTSITVGLQSASKEILKNINRSPNQPEALADLIKEAKKAGLQNSTEFIFGLPGETEDTIEESVKYVLKIKPTVCGFYILTVLVGSDIWLAQKEGKFQSLPQEFLQKKCKEAARRFYTNPQVFFNILNLVIKKNPKWLLKIASHPRYLMEVAGISAKKKTLAPDSVCRGF